MRTRRLYYLAIVLLLTNNGQGAHASLGANAGVNSLEWKLRQIVDGTLSFIKSSYEQPQGLCLRGVKQGLYSAGILKRYPRWPTAAAMDKIFKNNQQLKRDVHPEFKFVQLKGIKSVDQAPPFAILLYQGAPYGHIELKVPSELLLKRGFSHVFQSQKGKAFRTELKNLKFVYISDYIDAYPRNHPNSRVANKHRDNKRPLKAVYQIQIASGN